MPNFCGTPTSRNLAKEVAEHRCNIAQSGKLEPFKMWPLRCFFGTVFSPCGACCFAQPLQAKTWFCIAQVDLGGAYKLCGKRCHKKHTTCETRQPYRTKTTSDPCSTSLFEKKKTLFFVCVNSLFALDTKLSGLAKHYIGAERRKFSASFGAS